MKFKIINGTVFDPTQNLNGKIQDIFVENGFITNPSTAESAKYNIVYDVKGMVVMAGGIDIHSHIAGGNVNNARLLSPEIHSNFLENNLKRKSFLPGFNSRWTSEGTGYRYAEMGFTTVIEPAVTPINSFITQLELEKIPMIDKGCLAIVGNEKKHFYGVQFHPEVFHTLNGKVLIKNFLKLSNFSFNWSMQSYLQQSVEEIKMKVGNKKVICALSGGVDSSVTAILINKAIGNQLTCIYVNNGLMRKNESEEVLKLYREHYKLNLIEANEKNLFLSNLKGIKDPEKKRKIIGNLFIKIFESPFSFC